MKIFTPASAAKYLRALEDEKQNLLRRETKRCCYLAAAGEEPEVPVYDYAATRARVAQIDAIVRKVRHALHAHNVATVLPQGDVTVDEALIDLAQLSSQRRTLDDMRNRQQKERYDGYDPLFGRRRSDVQRDVVEYMYANYDVDQAERDYQEVYQRIIDLQSAIDYSNQTTSFEVDIEG